MASAAHRVHSKLIREKLENSGDGRNAGSSRLLLACCNEVGKNLLELATAGGLVTTVVYTIIC